MTNDFGNAGSRTHERGNAAKRALADSRGVVADSVGARPDEVVFTSGATEANNLAILGLAEHGLREGRRHILSSATEHKAVLEPLEHLASRGFDVELLRPSATGRFEVEDVTSRLRPDTLLVSLMHVNNETGVIQPVAEVAERLAGTPTYLHVDAAQSYAKVDREALTAPIDLISVSGHKIGAPMGIGALIRRRRGWHRVPLSPLMFGGGQERRLRPGTVPVPLAAGLGEAVQERSDHWETWSVSSAMFRAELTELVGKFGGVVNGAAEHGAPHILNVAFPGVDSEALIVALRGVADVATGSACTSASYTPSHVLVAMGLPEEIVRGSVRFSWWGRPSENLDGLRSVMESFASTA
jgi:cysteine desulfurase